MPRPHLHREVTGSCIDAAVELFAKNPAPTPGAEVGGMESRLRKICSDLTAGINPSFETQTQLIIDHGNALRMLGAAFPPAKPVEIGAEVGVPRKFYDPDPSPMGQGVKSVATPLERLDYLEKHLCEWSMEDASEVCEIARAALIAALPDLRGQK